MFNLSGSEVIVILILALVILGPDKLPDAMRRAGRTWAELRKLSSGFQEEVRKGFEEPTKEVRQTADAVRKAAAFPSKKLRYNPLKDPRPDDAGRGIGRRAGRSAGRRAGRSARRRRGEPDAQPVVAEVPAAEAAADGATSSVEGPDADRSTPAS